VVVVVVVVEVVVVELAAGTAAGADVVGTVVGTVTIGPGTPFSAPRAAGTVVGTSGTVAGCVDGVAAGCPTVTDPLPVLTASARAGDCPTAVADGRSDVLAATSATAATRHARPASSGHGRRQDVMCLSVL
jgi:hypothetical protein